MPAVSRGLAVLNFDENLRHARYLCVCLLRQVNWQNVPAASGELAILMRQCCMMSTRDCDCVPAVSGDWRS